MTKNKKTRAPNRWWLWLMIAAIVGIIFTTLSAFMIGLHGYQRDFKTYFHLTFQANLLAVLGVLLLYVRKNSVHTQRFKILVLVSLTIAGLVFWALILPQRGVGQYRAFSLIGTIIVHLITPSIALIAFGFDCKRRNNPIKLKEHKTIVIIMAYPILWLAMAIFVYYDLGYSIYSFLDFRNTPLWKTVLYIIIITLLFVGMTYLFVLFNNKYAVRNVKKR